MGIAITSSWTPAVAQRISSAFAAALGVNATSSITCSKRMVSRMATAEISERIATQKRAAAITRVSPWFKDAIIYQLHVRAFQDSNNDGIGDFRGLTSRLDYIQDLGVTAIWLLPFFLSPLKDD